MKIPPEVRLAACIAMEIGDTFVQRNAVLSPLDNWYSVSKLSGGKQIITKSLNRALKKFASYMEA